MADAPDSKSGPRKRVWVQVPPSVLKQLRHPIRARVEAPGQLWLREAYHGWFLWSGAFTPGGHRHRFHADSNRGLYILGVDKNDEVIHYSLWSIDEERQHVLFITPARNAKEAKDYFTRHMSTSDYYLRDAAEFAGEWHGLGAELLGLSGQVDKESYFNTRRLVGF